MEHSSDNLVMEEIHGWFKLEDGSTFNLLSYFSCCMDVGCLYVCYCKETIWIWRLQGDCNARTVCAVVVLDVVYRCAILISLDTGH